jgi:multicomponent K+:H+ antiporter subunit D
VAYLVVGSAGTLLLAVGLGTTGTVAAGVFYLVNSTLAAAAWFLLADRIAAARGGSDALHPMPLRSGWAALGIGFFVAAIAMGGLPPLAGFFGKALLLQSAGSTPLAAWVVALVLGSSLAVLVALARAGSALFWERPGGGTAARAGENRGTVPAHTIAIVALLACVLGAAAAAGPVAAYAEAAAAQLFERQAYIAAVLGARPVPAAFDVRREMREQGTAP